MAEIELGFVERVDNPDQLSSPFFPSKVGGRPAWLDLRDLPPPQKLACGVCGKPSVFLLQIHAPIPRQPWSFHRSFFVFMCKDPSCHQHRDFRAFRVLRCQLPGENDFYQQSSSDDNVDDGTQDSGSHGSSVSGRDIDRKQTKSNDVLCGDEGAVAGFSGIAIGDTNQTLSAASSEQDQPKMGSKPDAPEEATDTVESNNAAVYSSEYGQKKVCDKENKLPSSSPVTTTLPFEMPSLCVVCGCLGPKRCGKCRQPQYCSREHQVHDWKNGHKLFCSDIATGKSTEAQWNTWIRMQKHLKLPGSRDTQSNGAITMIHNCNHKGRVWACTCLQVHVHVTGQETSCMVWDEMHGLGMSCWSGDMMSWCKNKTCWSW